MKAMDFGGKVLRPFLSLFATAAVGCVMQDASAHVLAPVNAYRQSRNGEKTVLVWRENGSVKVIKPCTVELLLVGGGGGGGKLPLPASGSQRGSLASAGGGGGGGFIHKTTFDLTPGDWEILVGAGGELSMNGGDTSAFGLTAYGGGGGGGESNKPPASDGASGGGATVTMAETQAGTTRDGGKAIHGDQGHDGGSTAHVYGAGGGGGAGAAAPNDRTKASQPASGGDGLSCSITGTEVWYAGGGAGSRMMFPDNNADADDPCNGGKGGGGSVAHSSDEAVRRGTDGLGGGGAGGYRGGSGVVILSFVDDADPDFSDDFAIAGDGKPFGVGNEAYGRIFSADGTLTVTGTGSVDILLVGGGGGGGACDATYGGAGGGAGGFVYFTNVAVSAGTYSIKVGKGGACNANGGDSTALALIAYGGGAGGAVKTSVSSVGLSGGSGGGGRTHNGGSVAGGAALNIDYNIGHAGGVASNVWAPAGGGGAGEAGHDSDGTHTYVNVWAPGRGGDGLPCSITGREVWYAGGGTGCRFSLLAVIPGGRGGGADCGAAGRDGHGGGGSGGQRGGDGVVIVRVNRPSPIPRELEGATGGTLRKVKGHAIHTFNEDGAFVLPRAGWVDVLIVGGGGGGGSQGEETAYGGAGGGAGGFIYRQDILLDAGSYPVTVGAGGAIEQNGGNSSVFGLTAYGGGAGARCCNQGPLAQNGASGGGATISFAETMQSGGWTRAGGKAIYGDDDDGVEGNAGHNGGTCTHCYGTAGGGGAGAPGGDNVGSTPAAGGDGLPCAITGEEVWYAGGGGGYRPNWPSGGAGGKGGGGSSSNDAAKRKGVDGLGGGASGGAAGGRGVVIIRYKRAMPGFLIIGR